MDLLIEDMRRLLFTEYFGPAAARVFSMTCKANRDTYIGLQARGELKRTSLLPWPLQIQYICEGYRCITHTSAYFTERRWRTEELRTLAHDARATDWLRAFVATRPEFWCEGSEIALARVCAVATPTAFAFLYPLLEGKLSPKQSGTTTKLTIIEAISRDNNAALLSHVLATFTAPSGAKSINTIIFPDLDLHMKHACQQALVAILKCARHSRKCFEVLSKVVDFGATTLQYVTDEILFDERQIDVALIDLFIEEGALREETAYRFITRISSLNTDVKAASAIMRAFPSIASAGNLGRAICTGRKSLAALLLDHGAPMPTAPEFDSLAFFMMSNGITSEMASLLVSKGFYLPPGTRGHMMMLRALSHSGQQELLTEWVRRYTPKEALHCLHMLLAREFNNVEHFRLPAFLVDHLIALAASAPRDTHRAD